jgi:hypothetical protein
MRKDKHYQETLEMTAETVGRNLLQALVQEIKLLPTVWSKIDQSKQNEVIAHLRNRVETNVKMAVHLISAEGRTAVAGDLDQITIKDGVKAVIKFSASAAALHALYEASGKSVLVVVANPAQHTGGMDAIQGDSDQHAMDLDPPFDPDPDGYGDGGIGGDSNVVDAEVKAIAQMPLQAEMQQAYADGELAAQEGRPQSDCPLMAGELCIEWIKGWKAWHEAHPGGNAT